MNTTVPEPAAMEDLRKIWQLDAPAPGSWVHARKAQALDDFARSGFPTTRLENWKYTDVGAIASSYPQWLATQPNPTAAPGDRALEITGAVKIAFVDGIYRPDLSTPGALPEGVYAGSLTDLAAQLPQLESRYGLLANDTDSGFIALNTAFAASGVVLTLKANQHLEAPLHLHFHSSSAQLGTQPRVLLELAPNSLATVIEHYTSEGESIVNSVVEARCGEGASLDYCKIQDENHAAWHTASQYVELARAATLKARQLDLGAALARNELRLRLAGEGAHADCTGLFIADGSRHVDSRISVEHAAPNTTSRERYRGILADKARGVFNGRIYVEPEAQKTSAELTNRNLLLNRGAEIDTKPELEIYADDVKCAHGSTTGQLDDNSLFYLLSRGISAPEARKMLIAAFASELIQDIAIEAISDRVQDALSSLQSAKS